MTTTEPAPAATSRPDDVPVLEARSVTKLFIARGQLVSRGP